MLSKKGRERGEEWRKGGSGAIETSCKGWKDREGLTGESVIRLASRECQKPSSLTPRCICWSELRLKGDRLPKGRGALGGTCRLRMDTSAEGYYVLSAEMG